MTLSSISSCHKLLAFLYQRHSQVQQRQNLQSVQQLSEALGSSHLFFPSVHIAGTNGKGSVATKIAKALELSGWKVGLYTSPHLFFFCERIMVNNRMISEEEVVHGMEQILSEEKRLGLHLSFFDLTTLLAFDYFCRKNIDIAVIETGLGGRLDATNIITPLVSVITSISYDHQHVLGNSLEAIATEKAGIIKPKVPLVIGPKARVSPILQRAVELEAPLYAAQKILGDYDAENRAVASLALQRLHKHFALSELAIEKGIAARPSCRLEQKQNVIFDVAHNAEGFFRLLEAIDLQYPEKKVRALVGMSQDKDIKNCLELLTRRCCHIHLVQAEGQRASQPQALAEMLHHLGYGCFTMSTNIHQATLDALEFTREREELLLICGSFFIMKEAKEAFAVFSSSM